MTEETFFDLKNTEKKTFNKPNFLSFDYGNHLVRILGKPFQTYIHWIPRAKLAVKCLDEECPICKMNKQIILENPDNFRNVTGYLPRSSRHYFNLLDKTPVKVCPQCQTETKRGLNNQFPPTCMECGTFITDVKETPSGKVKVTNVSETTATELGAFHSSILDSNGDKLGLNNFDIMFMVTKVGDKKKISPIPLATNTDKVEIDAEFLYDLEKTVLTLTPDEIINLLKGVSLKDIFVARKGSDTNTEKLEESVTKTSEEIKNIVDSMYA